MRQLKKKLARWQTFETDKKVDIKHKRIITVPTDKYGTIIRSR